MLLTVEKVMILRSLDIFAHTPEDLLVEIALVAEEVTARAGDTLLEEGSLGTSLYVMFDGKVRVHANGRELAVLEGRQVFGELAALDPEPRSASVTALDDVVLLRLAGSALYDLMADHAELARGIIVFLCRRLRSTTAR